MSPDRSARASKDLPGAEGEAHLAASLHAASSSLSSRPWTSLP
jgi:hypothetical protein